MESVGVDFIDESEVLTIADDEYHIQKSPFKVPFVCGARNLEEALRRINEGAAMIRSKGEAGTGNVVHAGKFTFCYTQMYVVKHARAILDGVKRVQQMTDEDMKHYAKHARVPISLVQQVRELGRLPVVLFAAGGMRDMVIG